MTRRTPAQYDFTKLEFDEHILTKHFTPLGSRDILYVVVHHMTIVGTGSGSALDDCYRTWQSREASAHYGVDGTFITQFVWDKDYAWACGDTLGNLHGLHIEHANSTSGPKWLVDNATVMNGARLAANAHVLYKLGRPVDKKTLRQHDEFFATACPGPFLGGTEWAAYVKETQRVYDEITGTTPAVVKPAQHVAVWGKPETWVLGAVGPDIIRLGERIRLWSKALGLPDPYKVGPGQPLGPADVTGLSRLQVKWGYGSKPEDLALGGSSDGYPGPKSFAKLASNPPAKPAQVTVTALSQNMAGNNAHGIRTAKSRIARFVGTVKADPVDVIDAQETTVASTVRPRLDAGLKPLGMKRAGGGMGRYVYTSSRLKVIASGLITAPKSAWYKLDDKQAAWVIYDVDGARGMDVSFHAESDLGKKPDQLRVTQMLYFASASLGICHQYKVPEANVMLAGDTNSEGMVLAAMLKAGWRNVAAGTDFEDDYTFMGWDGRSRKRYDYGFVRADALPATLAAITYDTKISDHGGLKIVRQLTK